jgi:ribonuclease HII
MKPPPVDLHLWERRLAERGFARVCGIDEAGRGPLAGPVVAAAVILPFPCTLSGLFDSKQLTAAQRERAFADLQQVALAIGVGVIDNATIDRVNIRQATLLAMREALQQLPISPDYLLIDAMTLPDRTIPQEGIIHGDARSVSIAAASIIAKVMRDRMMLEYHRQWPQYDFHLHKGYGTKAHLQKIAEHGPSPLHRLTFRGATAGRVTTGKAGEEEAARFLEGRGYRVVARNVRTPHGEIDLVAEEGETLVFVEVKTRRRSTRGPAFDAAASAVDLRKQVRLGHAALAYLAEKGVDSACRFDVVAIDIGPNGMTFALFQNAFDLPSDD